MELLAKIDWIPIVTFILGLGILLPYIGRVKEKVHSLHIVIEAIDEMLKDGKLDKDEVKQLIEWAKKVMRKK